MQLRRGFKIKNPKRAKKQGQVIVEYLLVALMIAGVAGVFYMATSQRATQLLGKLKKNITKGKADAGGKVEAQYYSDTVYNVK